MGDYSFEDEHPPHHYWKRSVHDPYPYHHGHAHIDFAKPRTVVIMLKNIKTNSYIAVVNFNPQALQEWSPVKIKTGYAKLTEAQGDGLLTEKYLFKQASLPATQNHEQTMSGSKTGYNEYDLRTPRTQTTRTPSCTVAPS